jgi:hypothetical protein
LREGEEFRKIVFSDVPRWRGIKGVEQESPQIPILPKNFSGINSN